MFTFDRLKSKFQLPNSISFLFLQLRHAYELQFKSLTFHLEQDDFEVLCRDNNLSKPLSMIYKTLLLSVHVGLVNLRNLWHVEEQELDSENRDKDKFIEFKILHRMYYLPQRILCIYPNSPTSCWRCSGDPAGFAHIFWEYPQIQNYWQEVIQFKSALTTIPVPLKVSICLLGLVDFLAFARVMRTILLFYARKSIVLKWKSDRAPTLSFWKQLVNSVVPLYKATYLSQEKKSRVKWKSNDQV